MKILILAGGGGTRLWPLSRQDFPKQFLYFDRPCSLLQETVKRFIDCPIADEILVLTNSSYQHLVERQLEKVDAQSRVQILIEPCRRNTAPAIALGIKFLQKSSEFDENEPILVIPSDHFLEPLGVFLACLERVKESIQEGALVLFGIQPTKPETGYGYIEVGEKEGELHSIRRFVEKPDRKRAEEYLQKGKTYWNAGIFSFSAKTFWEEIERYAPDIFSMMRGDFEDCLKRFSNNPDISIDYAILERTKRAKVCPLAIHWSDVGSWDSVYDLMEKDENLNVKIGNVLEMDTKGSLIFSDKKLISTIGLEDVLIIDTEEATLISKKGESQKIKELVQHLYRNNLKGRELDKKAKSLAKRQGITVNRIYMGSGFKLEVIEIAPKGEAQWEGSDSSIEEWHWLSGMIEIQTKDGAFTLSQKEPCYVNRKGGLFIKNGSQVKGEAFLVQRSFSEGAKA